MGVLVSSGRFTWGKVIFLQWGEKFVSLVVEQNIPTVKNDTLKLCFLAYKYYTLTKKSVTWFPKLSARIRPEIILPLKNQDLCNSLMMVKPVPVFQSRRYYFSNKFFLVKNFLIAMCGDWTFMETFYNGCRFPIVTSYCIITGLFNSVEFSRVQW